MRKLIYSINITLDGFADHDVMIADDELHDFFTDQMNKIDIIIFGRKTYQLMESFWPIADKDSRSTRSMLDFANKINNVRKIVFSRSLNEVKWNNSFLAGGNLGDEVSSLKNQQGGLISIGGISIAAALMNLGLIDEYWFLIHPIILGKGKKLFENVKTRLNLKLIDTHAFNSGVVVMHYQNT